jgi:hypothetical protein
MSDIIDEIDDQIEREADELRSRYELLVDDYFVHSGFGEAEEGWDWRRYAAVMAAELVVRHRIDPAAFIKDFRYWVKDFQKGEKKEDEG